MCDWGTRLGGIQGEVRRWVQEGGTEASEVIYCIARDWIWRRGSVGEEDQKLVSLLPWSEWHVDSRGSSCGVRVWGKAVRQRGG